MDLKNGQTYHLERLTLKHILGGISQKKENFVIDTAIGKIKKKMELMIYLKSRFTKVYCSIIGLHSVDSLSHFVVLNDIKTRNPRYCALIDNLLTLSYYITRFRRRFKEKRLERRYKKAISNSLNSAFDFPNTFEKMNLVYFEEYIISEIDNISHISDSTLNNIHDIYEDILLIKSEYYFLVDEKRCVEDVLMKIIKIRGELWN